MTNRTTLDLTEADFEELLQSSATTGRPVLVDFWAAWCGPCRALAPTLDVLAQELDGQAIIAKVNIDEEPALAERFAIRSVPTLILFQGGKEAERVIGMTSAGVLKEKLEALATAA